MVFYFKFHGIHFGCKILEITEKGDILIMINKTIVYDKHLDDATNMLNLTETGEKKII
jgi:hypothetical protein